MTQKKNTCRHCGQPVEWLPDTFVCCGRGVCERDQKLCAMYREAQTEQCEHKSNVPKHITKKMLLAFYDYELGEDMPKGMTKGELWDALEPNEKKYFTQ